MMASQASKVHDPMYNFDTHFPDSLARVHLHSEAPASFRKRKSKAQRSGARYKTQPVTFDEITEVDEEPPNVNDDKPQGEKLKGQLQAFSRSMDGLLPRSSVGHEHSPHFSHSRSGSRKFQRHPDCIPERVEAESATSPQPQNSSQQRPFGLYTAENRVSDYSLAVPSAEIPLSSSVSSSLSSSLPSSSYLKPEGKNSQGEEVNHEKSPSSSLVGADADKNMTPSNMAPRRTKVTAKAKKRQKASDEGQGQTC